MGGVLLQNLTVLILILFSLLKDMTLRTHEESCFPFPIRSNFEDKCWMSNDFLELNQSNSEIDLCGLPYSIQAIRNNLGSLSVYVKSVARSQFESNLSLHAQVKRTVKSCFLNIRNITKMKSFLSSADLKKVILTFISTVIPFALG